MNDFDFPIKINNYFNNECAFFIGGIIASNESFIFGDKKIWLFSVRHNPGHATEEQLYSHQKLITGLAAKTKGESFLTEQLIEKKWFPNNKKGFAIVFYSKINVTIDDILEATHKLFENIDENAIQSFLAGSFDGRSSLDISRETGAIRNIALDCSSEEGSKLIQDKLTRLDIQSNFNVARERIEGGRARNPQLRIVGSSIPKYMSKVGFVSPVRFNKTKNALSQSLYLSETKVLLGLKTLVPTRSLK